MYLYMLFHLPGREIVAARSSSSSSSQPSSGPSSDNTGVGRNGSGSARARAIVSVNAGGPYGSEVLKGVQEDSDKVSQGDRARL